MLRNLGKWLPVSVKGKLGLLLSKNLSYVPLVGLPLLRLLWGSGLKDLQGKGGLLCIEGMEFPKHSLPAFINIYIDQVYDTFWIPQEGQTVIDIGACTGMYSVKCSRLIGKDGRVIAVEPSPEALVYLRNNLSLYLNSTIYPKALSSEKVSRRFFLSGMHGGFTSYKSKRTTEVEADTLDSMVKELRITKVDYIKINTAFSINMEILQGTRDTLRKYSPKVVIYAPYEIQGRRKGLGSILGLLRSLGYESRVSGICIHASKEW